MPRTAGFVVPAVIMLAAGAGAGTDAVVGAGARAVAAAGPGSRVAPLLTPAASDDDDLTWG